MGDFRGFRRFCGIFFAVCILVCWVDCLNWFVLPVAADASEVVTSEYSEVETSAALPDPEDRSDDQSEFTLVSVTSSSDVITASNSTGFKSIILSLFGDYELITKDYTYQNYNGSTQHSITTLEDWPWIISAGIFSIVLWSVFRFIGGIFCGRE